MAGTGADKADNPSSPSAGKEGSNSPGSPGSPAPRSPTPAREAPQTSGSPGMPGPTEPLTFHGAQHWADQPLFEVGDGDVDSAYGDVGSSTASITSSILNYRTINGRTYHSDRGSANYWASNDQRQNDSIEMQHHVYLLLSNNKLHQAPLEKPKKVLDVGTGTGVWAIDFADENPDCQVIGTDVSPVQPVYVPLGLSFEIEDCTQMPWTFADNSFDFVHLRLLYGSIVDWFALFREAYRVTKPGGWIETVEGGAPHCLSDDGTVKEGSAAHEWGKFFVEAGRRLGRTFEIIEQDIQPRGLAQAGFTNIQQWNYKVPVGAWPKDPKLKEAGRLAYAAFDQDWEGYLSYPAKMVSGWTEREVAAYCAVLRSEFRSGRMHAYYRMRAVWGRKPE